MTTVFPPNTQLYTAEWVLPVSAPAIYRGFIAVQGQRIIGVGAVADLSDAVVCPEITPGTLITPGLVNVHTHLEQSFPEVVSKKPNAPFSDWLLAVVKQNREQGSSEEKQARANAGCDECLATGTTCVNDLASGVESLQALDAKGLRGYVSLEFFHPSVNPVNVEGMSQAYQWLQALYHGHPRLWIGVSPHAPYNFAPSAWNALIEACQPSLIHAHVAESGDESRYVQGLPSGIPELHQRILGTSFQPEFTATSPVAYLAQAGLLNDRTILAHAVNTNAEDRQQLADAGVTIAHCPRSNLFLLGHTLDYSDWVDSSVVMGLGTDGRVSTEDLDLRAEARCAQARHGWSARKTLEMMTLSGAKALHLDAQIGSLDVGKQADFVLWQADGTHETPEAAVLAKPTHVCHVWTDGQSRWKAEG